MEFDCQDTDLLRAWSLGQLPQTVAEPLSQHVADCAACEQTLAGLDDTADSLVGAVRSAAHTDRSPALPSSAPLQTAIEKLVDPFPAETVPSETSQLQNPQERIRDYELLDSLGFGGMGTVYRARHLKLDRIVAVKVLPAGRLRDTQAVERFHREMRAIGRLNHPAIVRATDAGESNGHHFLAMEYIDGMDVSRLVRVQGPLPLSTACEIVRQTAVALHYAHSEGLVHRDVKPGNLMLTSRSDGRGDAQAEVKLLDLGLALYGAASESVDDLTTVGQLMGTLDYMAPEQADSSHTVDHTADIYSLGATLFKLTSGRPPYDSPNCRTPLARMKALSLQEPPSLRIRCPDAPEELVQLADSMLQRSPQDRPSSADEVARRIEPFCQDHQLEETLQIACTRCEAAQPALSELRPAALSTTFSRSHEAMPEAMPARTPPTTSGDDGNQRRRWTLWHSTGAVVLGCLLAALIVLKTDRGTLQIETAVADLPIEIRQGDEVVRHMVLTSGTNAVTLASGKYRVHVPVAYDQLQVENNRIEIQRGGQWLVRVTERPQTTSDHPAQRLEQHPGDQLREPMFAQRTFAEWQQQIQYERSPAELNEAVQALCTLGRNSRDLAAAATVLQIVTRLQARQALLNTDSQAPQTDQSSEYRLLITIARQLQSLEPQAVVQAVIETLSARREPDGSGARQSRSSPDLEFFVASRLAAQREWWHNASMRTENQFPVAHPGGNRLARTFDESNKWLAFLTTHYAQLTQPLQLHLLARLTEPASGADPIPLTQELRQLAVDSADGRYGDRVTLAAWELLARRMTDPVADRLLEYIAEHPELPERMNLISTNGVKTDWPVHHWGAAEMWLRALLHHRASEITDVPRLAAFIRDPDRTAGQITLQVNIFRQPEDPVLYGPGGEASSASVTAPLTEALLATETAAASGSTDPELLAALTARAEQVFSPLETQPDAKGPYGYVPTRKHSLIPTPEQILTTGGNAATFPFPDMTITNRESVLYALHRLTGRPVRFNSPLTEATKQGWAQLVEVNGRSMAELKKIATATEPQNASEAAEVYGEMVRWCAADPHARTIESLLPLIGPLLSRVVRAPASDVSGEELMTFYQCIETATGGLERLSINHRHLLTQLLEAAEDPVWHQRLLRSMLCQSRPVLVAGNHYDKSEAGSFDDPVFLEGWQTKPVFNAKIPRGGGGQKKRSMALDADLEHVLQRLMTESDVAASEAVEPLLDYVSLAVPSTAARAFLVRLLDSDRAEYRNRAASLLMYRWRDDTTIRDRVFKVMLDTVLESDSDAEAINAWKTLVGGPRSGLKPWNYRQEELHRILDFIETHHGQPEPMFRPGRQVASDMPLSSSPGDSAPPSVYPVSRRILALTLLLRIDRTPHAPDVSLPRLLKLLPAAPPAVETPFATPLSRRKTSPLRTVFQMAHEKEIDRLQQTSPAAIESDEDVYNDILTDIVQILKR